MNAEYTSLKELVIAIKDSLDTANSNLAQALSKLDEILNILSGAPPERIHLDTKYPEDRKTVTSDRYPANVTVDIRTGDVILPDGTTERLTTSIDDICHSILFYTSKKVLLELFEGSRSELKTTVYPGYWRKCYNRFDKIVITVYEETDISLVISTENEGVPEVNISFEPTTEPTLTYWKGRTKGYEDTLTESVSPVTCDVYGDLGRVAHGGYIVNDGDGDMKVQFEDPDEGWGDEHTLKKDEWINLSMLNIKKIRLTWVADCNYRIMVV